MTPPEGFPTFSLPTSSARRLRDALEPIATQGWWSRAVAERLSALGLDFFEAYVWGRAASLGEPAAATVVATFGVFDPALLTAVYKRGSSTASRGRTRGSRTWRGRESSRRSSLPTRPRWPTAFSRHSMDWTGWDVRCSPRCVPSRCQTIRLDGCGGRPSSCVNTGVMVISRHSWHRHRHGLGQHPHRAVARLPVGGVQQFRGLDSDQLTTGGCPSRDARVDGRRIFDCRRSRHP